MKKIVCSTLLLLAVFSLPAQKRALRFEDMFAAGRLAAPVVSADGRWIAFTVRVPELEKNSFRTDFYLIDSNGRNLKKLDVGKDHFSLPSFPGPDTLAFISTASGEPQLYSLNLANPAAVKQLTQFPGGLNGYIWSPDKKSIAFSKEVFPQASSLKENAVLEKDKGNSPVKARLLTSLPFRVWNAWKDGKRSHVFLHTLGVAGCRDLTPGDFDTPPIDLGDLPTTPFRRTGNSSPSSKTRIHWWPFRPTTMSFSKT